jgi:hypothetical protein
MRSQNLLLVACIAMVWSAAAAAQGTPQGGAQTARGGQNQSAAPATSVGTTTPGTQTPVRQPNTSPPPSAPTPAPANTSPPPSPSSSMPQQTVVPNQPNSASNARDTSSANRARVATQTDTVPPASRGVGTTASRPDCSQMRGIEKSECERRGTSRDDLPAGVTTTQQPQPPR